MTRNALLAADCGSGVGLGHLERMLALADALYPDLDVSLILPKGDRPLLRRVADRSFTTIEALGSSAERVAAVVDAAPLVDVVVLDGYVFDVELQRTLRARAPLVVVDDLRMPANCDLGVNPSPCGGSMRPTGADAFLGGAPYALISGSFLQAREIVSRSGRRQRTVLISTGATDLDGIGVRVTDDLLEMDTTLRVTRVVGPDSHGAIGDHRPRERQLVAPASLAHVFTEATIYVGAAGTTAVQAACVGVPAVITAAVPNQEAQAAALAAAGCALVVDAGDLAATCLRLLNDESRCEDMASRGRALIDGHGASRVAEAVRALFGARVPR
ncbi:MAG: hypothetical protein WCB51_06650 [Candidatus Dormiibacterota bacterium]